MSDLIYLSVFAGICYSLLVVVVCACLYVCMYVYLCGNSCQSHTSRFPLSWQANYKNFRFGFVLYAGFHKKLAIKYYKKS